VWLKVLDLGVPAPRVQLQRTMIYVRYLPGMWRACRTASALKEIAAPRGCLVFTYNIDSC
jgi:hypothetical protein